MPSLAQHHGQVTRLRPPPRHLGQEGAAFWKNTLADYQLDTESQLAQLQVAAEALDRMASCRKSIEREGLSIRHPTRGTVPHPLLKVENAARATFLTALRALRLQPSSSDGARR